MRLIEQIWEMIPETTSYILTAAICDLQQGCTWMSNGNNRQ